MGVVPRKHQKTAPGRFCELSAQAMSSRSVPIGVLGSKVRAQHRGHGHWGNAMAENSCGSQGLIFQGVDPSEPGTRIAQEPAVWSRATASPSSATTRKPLAVHLSTPGRGDGVRTVGYCRRLKGNELPGCKVCGGTANAFHSEKRGRLNGYKLYESACMIPARGGAVGTVKIRVCWVEGVPRTQ